MEFLRKSWLWILGAIGAIVAFALAVRWRKPRDMRSIEVAEAVVAPRLLDAQKRLDRAREAAQPDQAEVDRLSEAVYAAKHESIKRLQKAGATADEAANRLRRLARG